MLAQTLKTLLLRDLQKLQQEITLYKNEEAIWYTEKQISNAAGNLCLHLVGNLSYFIGTVLGNTGYVRNREEEFSLKNIPSAKLQQQISETIQVVEKTLDTISDEQLSAIYPVKVFEKEMTTEYFLVHLATHLGYHLGQVNYHRRLLDN